MDWMWEAATLTPSYDSFLFGSTENNVIMRKNGHGNKLLIA